MAPSFSWLVVLVYLGLAGCVGGQAPGDGDLICTNETINGVQNPFFGFRPVYSPNERPLIDSRDYISLLQGDNVPWQSIDNDNNNTAGVATSVSLF